MQERNKIQKIGIVKSAVAKAKQLFQIGIGMVYTKIVRRIVHKLQKQFAFIDNGFANAPCKNCREKPGNFYILFF